jgi:hypothetical protein
MSPTDYYCPSVFCKLLAESGIQCHTFLKFMVIINCGSFLPRIYKKVVHPIIFTYWKAMQEAYLTNSPRSICLTGDGQVSVS